MDRLKSEFFVVHIVGVWEKNMSVDEPGRTSLQGALATKLDPRATRTLPSLLVDVHDTGAYKFHAPSAGRVRTHDSDRQSLPGRLRVPHVKPKRSRENRSFSFTLAFVLLCVIFGQIGRTGVRVAEHSYPVIYFSRNHLNKTKIRLEKSETKEFV